MSVSITEGFYDEKKNFFFVQTSPHPFFFSFEAFPHLGKDSAQNFLQAISQSIGFWIRYRARAIKGIKANHKRSWTNNLECRFCDSGILESQEHLEACGGLSWERRGLKMDTVGGKINFFKRVEKKLG